ncbi:MAG: hypothetical protein JJT94_11335 [Bernardetiaceae bacterium]|nr:hypothetical protein [Bernardetiaceae bacterium]
MNTTVKMNKKTLKIFLGICLLVFMWDALIYYMNHTVRRFPSNREEAIKTGTWIADYELCYLDTTAIKAFKEIYNNDNPFEQDFFIAQGYRYVNYLIFLKKVKLLGDSKLAFSNEMYAESNQKGDSLRSLFCKGKIGSIRYKPDNDTSYYRLPPRRGNSIFISGTPKEIELNCMFYVPDTLKAKEEKYYKPTRLGKAVLCRRSVKEE